MSTEQTVLTVTQLNRHIRSWLENEMGAVSVQGELSNLSRPSSGHAYFTLKDTAAQVRCVYFKNRHVRADLQALHDGQLVVASGTLSLYEARGDYQLIVQSLVLAGAGDLHQQFAALKLKLAALGLFESARKQALPVYPQSIGVITSPSGAALRDILATLARRFPLATVIIYPSDVQGKRAPQQLCQALMRANTDKSCDVLILARGGGSLEDLWAFNDESLAYAIAASDLPVVTGIGHETDFTIADFVADLRAATPTAAATAVTPDAQELLYLFVSIQQRLQAAAQRLIRHQRLLLDHAMRAIRAPGRLIMMHWQTLDDLNRRLYAAVNNRALKYGHTLHLLNLQLHTKNPGHHIQEQMLHTQALQSRLLSAMRNIIVTYQHDFAATAATLNAVSPLATLERGYALITQNDHLITRVQQVSPGSQIDMRLVNGHLSCQVLEQFIDVD